MAKDSFLTSKEWRDCRAAYLAVFRRCAVPGCEARPTHVDHVRSRRRGGDPLSWSNLQALCHGHHSTKTNYEDGGFGNERGRPVTRLRVKGCSEDGTPCDPLHHWRNK